jgi:hypothetical protein
MLIPLTQVKVLAVRAEIGTGEIRAGNPFPVRRETTARDIAPEISVVVWPLAERYP